MVGSLYWGSCETGYSKLLLAMLNSGNAKAQRKGVVMIAVQIVAGVLAVAVCGIIVYRRKQKAV
jgi:hypothetical protein